MKVVINALSARNGGGQTYLQNILRNLPDHDGFRIALYAPSDLDVPDDSRIERMKTSWPTENPYLRALWERFALPGILKSLQADVLFCPGGVVTTRVPKGCRVVTMFRNMIPFDERVLKRVPPGLARLRNFLLKRLMLRSYASADLSIFISHYALGVIQSLGPIKRAIVVPHGIGADFRTAGGQALPRPDWLPDGRYMLYVSRFDTYKHHREVVAAYARLPEELRAAVGMVLVGEDDMPEAEHVRQSLRELGLESRVFLAGKRKYAQLPAVYQHAELILFASSCENCPNILLESLGAGRPVISSDVMPMPEFGGQAVAYFSPYDPKNISETMQQVLSDPERMQQLGVAAAERSERYRWEQTARETWGSIIDLARPVGTEARP
ncbi:Glycosyl transferase, group 1 [plant metagenome]|uniref:Glycosyl transferase, group 1 n=1 Tax=plant metagenome TaxID=1297885 RepID=A0A484SRI9_9ZZZZ